MPSVKIVKDIDLNGIRQVLIGAAEEGVEAAVQEAVSWIKNDVLLDQEYVGNRNFPDVTEATKKRKRKKGNIKVLIDSGTYKDSFIGECSGLVGKVRSGSRGYFKRLHKKWRIDKLWRDRHSGVALDIIDKTIDMAMRKHRFK